MSLMSLRMQSAWVSHCILSNDLGGDQFDTSGVVDSIITAFLLILLQVPQLGESVISTSL